MRPSFRSAAGARIFEGLYRAGRPTRACWRSRARCGGTSGTSGRATWSICNRSSGWWGPPSTTN